LAKWAKETGGGDGAPVEFQNFCGGDRWLGWVFLKDEEVQGLLRSGASGETPTGLHNEAGAKGTHNSTKKRKHDELSGIIIQGQKNQEQTLSTLSSLIEAFKTPPPVATPSLVVTSEESNCPLKALKELQDYQESLKGFSLSQDEKLERFVNTKRTAIFARMP
jgi:hypothetical protein